MNEELRDIIYDINPDIEVYQNENLIEMELIDSLDMITLIGEIEAYYGVVIDAEDVSMENFETIDNIERLLERYLKGE